MSRSRTQKVVSNAGVTAQLVAYKTVNPEVLDSIPGQTSGNFLNSIPSIFQYTRPSEMYDY